MKIIRVLAFFALGFAMLAFVGLWILRSLPRPHPRAPLEVAAVNGSREELRRELAVRPGAWGSEGLGALIWASRTGRADSIAELVHAGVDPNQQDSGPNNWTPLLHAVHKGQLGALHALIAAGADPNKPNPKGITPLMLACSQGEAEIVDALLAAGADPYARQKGDETALTYAMTQGNGRVIRTLLRKAPNLRLTDSWEGHLARLLARFRGQRDVLRLLNQPPAAPAVTAEGGRR
ncbi:MAG TPA: ankyrin repeat domain-containing protein [Thermoanaerobaculia bacterium]|nr:ankyrin repeat domain-containing protein [Thermoanaerobaculia bacterium]